jgi:hypothetical protein
MTPKLIAKPSSVHRYPKHAATLITQCGRKFTWGHLAPHLNKAIEVGDKVWIASRLPVRSEDWCYELYEVVIQPYEYMVKQGFKDYPKTFFGNGRDIVWEIK